MFKDSVHFKLHQTFSSGEYTNNASPVLLSKLYRFGSSESLSNMSILRQNLYRKLLDIVSKCITFNNFLIELIASALL